MAQPIAAPKRTTVYPFNLLDTFGYKKLPDKWGVEGVVWELESCDLPTPYDVDYCPPSIEKPDAFTSPGESDTITVQGIQAAFTCATVGNSIQETTAKAKKILDDGRIKFISEFWLNEIQLDPSLITLPGGPFTPDAALARAQDIIAANFGRSAIIYAPPGIISYWTHRSVYKDGKILRTVLDNIVVALPNSDGNIYVSDAIPDIYLSELKILDAEMVRVRNINSYLSRVEQLYLIRHDPCALYAIPACG